MVWPHETCRSALPENLENCAPTGIALGDVIDIPLAVAFQADTPVLYYWFNVALVMGESLVTAVEGVRDIQFGVMWAQSAESTLLDGPCYDRTMVASLLTREERWRLRDLMCRAVVKLCAYCRPRTVTMSTAETWLPDNALQKFLEMESAMNQAGWSTRRRYRDAKGHNHWHFVSQT